MSEVINKPEAAQQRTNDRRCSCYDADCHLVKNPLLCWTGGTYWHAGELVEMPIADGYCPLLRR